VVTSVSVPAPDPELGIVAAAALVSPGTELRLPPREYVARYAYAICIAPDLAGCRRRLQAAANRLALEWRPLPVSAVSGGGAR
jgi:hypothetical protein